MLTFQGKIANIIPRYFTNQAGWMERSGRCEIEAGGGICSGGGGHTELIRKENITLVYVRLGNVMVVI